MWKKRYFEEKKRSPPMEDHLNKQRTELDSIHRKIMGMMETYIKENRSRGENQVICYNELSFFNFILSESHRSGRFLSFD